MLIGALVRGLEGGRRRAAVTEVQQGLRGAPPRVAGAVRPVERVPLLGDRQPRLRLVVLLAAVELGGPLTAFDCGGEEERMLGERDPVGISARTASTCSAACRAARTCVSSRWARASSTRSAQAHMAVVSRRAAQPSSVRHRPCRRPPVGRGRRQRAGRCSTAPPRPAAGPCRSCPRRTAAGTDSESGPDGRSPRRAGRRRGQPSSAARCCIQDAGFTGWSVVSGSTMRRNRSICPRPRRASPTLARITEAR